MFPEKLQVIPRTYATKLGSTVVEMSPYLDKKGNNEICKKQKVGYIHYRQNYPQNKGSQTIDRPTIGRIIS